MLCTNSSCLFLCVASTDMKRLRAFVDELVLSVMLIAFTLTLLPVVLGQIGKEYIRAKLFDLVDYDSAYLSWHNWDD